MKPIVLLYLLAVSTLSVKLSTINDQFSTLNEVNVPLKPAVEPSADQEINLYEQMREVLLQDLTFDGDSKLNCQFELDKERTRESLWVKGNELSRLLLEIHVMHQNILTKTDINHEINFFMVNHSSQSQELLHSRKIHSIFLVQINCSSDLLQLIFQRQPMEGIEHISVKAALVSSSPSSLGSSQHIVLAKLKKASQELGRIFLDSLENWEHLDKERQEHKHNQWLVSRFFSIQLFLVAIIYMVEFTLLRSYIRNKSIL